MAKRGYTILGGPSEDSLRIIGEVEADNHETAKNIAKREFGGDFLDGDFLFVVPSSSLHAFVFR